MHILIIEFIKKNLNKYFKQTHKSVEIFLSKETINDNPYKTE